MHRFTGFEAWGSDLNLVLEVYQKYFIEALKLRWTLFALGYLEPWCIHPFGMPRRAKSRFLRGGYIEIRDSVGV